MRRCRIRLLDYTIVLFVLTTAFLLPHLVSSSSTTISSSSSRRRLFPTKTHYGSRSSRMNTNPRNTQTNPKHTHTHTKQVTRSACRLFIWDGMSASRYHVCKRLLRDNVYEGLGGKKFVRIRPGSVLASLYPLSKHSPDRCLLCNQSFPNHLTSWWFSQLYTPYDLTLDGTRKEGRRDYCDSSGDEGEGGGWGLFGRRRRVSKMSKSRSSATRGTNSLVDEDGVGVLAYHKRYIHSILSPKPPTPEYNVRTKSSRQTTNLSPATPRPNNTSTNTSKNPIGSIMYETRESGNTQYTIPKMKIHRRLGLVKASLLVVARELVLLDLDQHVVLQQLENEFNERKVRYDASS